MQHLVRARLGKAHPILFHHFIVKRRDHRIQLGSWQIKYGAQIGDTRQHRKAAPGHIGFAPGVKICVRQQHMGAACGQQRLQYRTTVFLPILRHLFTADLTLLPAE